MKIVERACGSMEPEEISEVVSAALDGNDYDLGVVEAATATGENLREAFGRLIDVLAQKELITAEDVFHVAGLYVGAPKHAQFVAEAPQPEDHAPGHTKFCQCALCTGAKP